MYSFSSCRDWYLKEALVTDISGICTWVGSSRGREASSLLVEFGLPEM